MTIYDVNVRLCLWQLFFLPAVVVLFSLGLFVVNGMILVNSLKKHRQEHRISVIGRVAVALLCFCAMGFMSLTRLSRGCVLLLEKEEDAVTLTGTIQGMERDRFSPRFSAGPNGTVSYASLITIDDKQYYCLTSDRISKDDRVSIRYLPRSKIIVSCTKNTGEVVDHE